MWYRMAVLLAVLVALSLPALGQVKAYTDQTEQIKELVSPMVLEIPLRGMVAQGENEEWVTTETKGFSCRGVVAEKVAVRFRVAGGNDGKLEVRGVVYVRNLHPEDTKTSITYALVSGARTLDTDTEPGFATEENKPRFKKFSLAAPVRDVPDLGECVLRLTLTVEPD